MEHEPAKEWQNERSQGFKTKTGLIMFAIYIPVYMAFILISVISPKTMATEIGPLNLAIVYGFGIIILAIVQAVIYNYICSKKEKLDNPSKGGAE